MKLLYVRNTEDAAPISHLSFVNEGEELKRGLEAALNHLNIKEAQSEIERVVMEKGDFLIGDPEDLYSVILFDGVTEIPTTKEGWEEIKKLAEIFIQAIKDELQESAQNLVSKVVENVKDEISDIKEALKSEDIKAALKEVLTDGSLRDAIRQDLKKEIAELKESFKKFFNKLN
jgi:ketosteroid isomerase-like protein